ncbi:MAG: hypothetical protein CMO30_06370 [Tistrella sp.]|uniref:hypothetical protein n=1 Tax=Tistrella sp. TaxID=2024861 RepID=UPI000C37A5DC|nr:hypothetical protein [Tistrella sp.]MAD39548.1 hypothetical protein [Tistrella sp.]MBA74893.1 hypothetical protein [Tistrella sp.]|tara:strand:+ start:372 stop:713 length:342 start_codon:yes stop_codon:yes gene_type:complete
MSDSYAWLIAEFDEALEAAREHGASLIIAVIGTAGRHRVRSRATSDGMMRCAREAALIAAEQIEHDPAYAGVADELRAVDAALTRAVALLAAVDRLRGAQTDMRDDTHPALVH